MGSKTNRKTVVRRSTKKPQKKRSKRARFTLTGNSRMLLGGIGLALLIFGSILVLNEYFGSATATPTLDLTILTAVAETYDAEVAAKSGTSTSTFAVNSTPVETQTPDIFVVASDFPGSLIRVLDSGGQNQTIVTIKSYLANQQVILNHKIGEARQNADGSWEFIDNPLSAVYRESVVDNVLVLNFLLPEYQFETYYFSSEEINCWPENSTSQYLVFPVYEGKITEVIVNFSTLALAFVDQTGEPVRNYEIRLGVEKSTNDGKEIVECSRLSLGSLVTDHEGNVLAVIAGDASYWFSGDPEELLWQPIDYIEPGQSVMQEVVLEMPE